MKAECFYKLNRALLSKWSWHIANERDSLWRKVIYTKFREERGDGVLVM